MLICGGSNRPAALIRLSALDQPGQTPVFSRQYGALAVASEPGRVWAPDLLNFQLPIFHRGALCVCAGECDA